MIFTAKKVGPRWRVYAPNGAEVDMTTGDESYVTNRIKNKFENTEYLGEYLERDDILVVFENQTTSDLNDQNQAQEPPQSTEETTTPEVPNASDVSNVAGLTMDAVTGTNAGGNTLPGTSTDGNAAPGATTNTNVPTPSLNPSDIIEDSKDKAGNGKGLDNNTVMNKGVVFPIIRINDHYCTSDEIKEFYIETGYFKNYHEYNTMKMAKTGFVPTMHLIISTSAPDLLKNNLIKSGDKCAVFFSNGGGMVKSYRGDYIITNVVTSLKPTEQTDTEIIYIINGELYVPMLRNETQRFNFNGTSRDALMDAAQKLGLGFYFCDPDNTDDYQGWVCSTNLYDYCCEVAAHAWKEFESFYECWIDPRYGLSFINMNTMLIADGFDEPLDLTPYVNMIHSSVGIDGKKSTKTEEQKRRETLPLAKMLTNIPTDEESTTPFYVVNWNIVNRAAEISNEIGINNQQSLNIDNAGVDTENTNVDMQYSIPVNMKKIQNGFFVLIGPGVNLTYTQADQINPNMSFVKNSYKVMGGGITEVMSNDDAAMIEANGNNMMSSGNNNRFYDPAFYHNMRNVLQLEKQYTEVELLGCNLAIMRGEKIPALILDHDKVQSVARSGNWNKLSIQGVLYEMACGWYVIDGIMWKWSVNDNSNGTTLWRTHLKLVRREWPIPGRGAVENTTEGEYVQEHTVDTADNADTSSTANSGNYESIAGLNTNVNYAADGGALSDGDTMGGRTTSGATHNTLNNGDMGSYAGVGTSASSAVQVAEDDQVKGDEVPLTGLRDELKYIYKMIKSRCLGVKLVSARRWAVDDNGNRVAGNAIVQRNGLYKCVNAKGEEMYFKSNNSRHLYGEAFDIINDSGLDFNSIMTDYVMVDDSIIQAMAEYGVAACIEQTTDDSGVATKHYHFGTDEGILNNYWDSVLAINTQMTPQTMQLVRGAAAARKRYATAEIKNTVVDEYQQEG